MECSLLLRIPLLNHGLVIEQPDFSHFVANWVTPGYAFDGVFRQIFPTFRTFPGATLNWHRNEKTQHFCWVSEVPEAGVEPAHGITHTGF